jgi:hypothetical protein
MGEREQENQPGIFIDELLACSVMLHFAGSPSFTGNTILFGAIWRLSARPAILLRTKLATRRASQLRNQ